MKLEGNLTQFFPPDLLLFINSLGKDGVLTVNCNTHDLTITFKSGFIIDALSETADHKIIKSLLIFDILKPKDHKYVLQVKKETDMSVIQILENMNIPSDKKINQICLNGLREVFFEFFNLKEGFFKFTEVSVETQKSQFSIHPQTIALEISRWVDEAGKLEQDLAPCERNVSVVSKPGDLSQSERIFIHGINGKTSISDVVRQSHLPTLSALKLLKKLVEEKTITLGDTEGDGYLPENHYSFDSCFPAFKKSGKKILFSKNIKGKLSGLLDYSKACFDHFFIISLSHTELIHMDYFYRDENGGIKKIHKQNIKKDLNKESVLSHILEEGTSYFGDFFQSMLSYNLIKIKNKEMCAVIPFEKQRDSFHFLYVVSSKEHAMNTSFKYLEILSWMVNTDRNFNKVPIPDDKKNDQEIAEILKEVEPARNISEIAKTVNTLPPMSHIVTDILKLFSDPDFDIEDLVRLISQDQAIMASVIKISNSVFYKSVHPVSTLKEAIKRMGVIAVKSSVIMTSTRTFFTEGTSEFNVYSIPLWIHYKECAIMARRVALTTGSHNPDEAFVAGILHDIGKLAILMNDIENSKSIKIYEQTSGKSSFHAEKEILGYTHMEIGGLLMNKWNMPENLSHCVKYHHTVSVSNKGESCLTDMVILGNYYSHLLKENHTDELPENPEHIQKLLQILGLDHKDEESMIQKMKQDLGYSELFD